MTENIRSLKGPELREHMEAEWNEQDRRWARAQEFCQCYRPVPWMWYLRQAACARCKRWIPKERLNRKTLTHARPVPTTRR